MRLIYAGSVCVKHPELQGKRFKANYTCPGCAKDAARKNREITKLAAITYYSNGTNCCERCKISDIDVLTIDHINQDGMNHRKENGVVGKTTHGNVYGVSLASWLKKNKYPPGFRVLCFNCNIKVYLEFIRGKSCQ